MQYINCCQLVMTGYSMNVELCYPSTCSVLWGSTSHMTQMLVHYLSSYNSVCRYINLALTFCFTELACY